MLGDDILCQHAANCILIQIREGPTPEIENRIFRWPSAAMKAFVARELQDFRGFVEAHSYFSQHYSASPGGAHHGAPMLTA